MKKIFLIYGEITLVSDEDFIFLSGYDWRLKENRRVVCSGGYVDGINSRLIHRIIAKRAGIDCTNEIDHIDRNPLNNQRENLRAATRSQNSMNSKIPVTNTSGYKGVYWRKERKKWYAKIRVGDSAFYLGSFTTPEEASEAYNKAADHYFGEFASY